jgi:elongation factor P
MKKAILQNDMEIEVPEFIKNGERVLIRTADGTYIGRDKE